MKTRFLRWNNIRKLQSPVNRRIAAELNIRQRRRPFKGPVYSSDGTRTWDHVFPRSVSNRIGSNEPVFEYIARHTFYTPRNILTTCQRILEKLLETEASRTPETIQASEAEWTSAIQEACEEESNSFVQNILDIYSTIYPGIESVLGLFEHKPNIWPADSFRQFLREHGEMKSADTGKSLTGEQIIPVLYSMGFVGYGFASRLAPPMAKYYDMEFSYYNSTTRATWELAVISPVFYDRLRIAAIPGIVVAPHKPLQMRIDDSERIAGFDSKKHST